MKPRSQKPSRDPVSLWLSTDTEIFKRDEYEDLVTRNGFAAVGFVTALTGTATTTVP